MFGIHQLGECLNVVLLIIPVKKEVFVLYLTGHLKSWSKTF